MRLCFSQPQTGWLGPVQMFNLDFESSSLTTPSAVQKAPDCHPSLDKEGSWSGAILCGQAGPAGGLVFVFVLRCD
jgi:hypothetical protein